MNRLEKIIKDNNLNSAGIIRLCNNEISMWSHYLNTSFKVGIVSAAFFIGSGITYLNNKSDSAKNIAAISGLAMAGSYLGLRRTLKELSEISTFLKNNYNEKENSTGGEYNANGFKN